MRDPSALGRQLESLRLKGGQSQQTVADFCGISQAALSRYEKGERFPCGKALLALASHYRVDMGVLLIE